MHTLCHGCPNHFIYSYSFQSYNNPIINLVCDKIKAQRGLVLEPGNCESDSKDLTLATAKIPILFPYLLIFSHFPWLLPGNWEDTILLFMQPPITLLICFVYYKTPLHVASAKWPLPILYLQLLLWIQDRNFHLSPLEIIHWSNLWDLTCFLFHLNSRFKIFPFPTSLSSSGVTSPLSYSHPHHRWGPSLSDVILPGFYPAHWPHNKWSRNKPCCHPTPSLIFSPKISWKTLSGTLIKSKTWFSWSVNLFYF